MQRPTTYQGMLVRLFIALSVEDFPLAGARAGERRPNVDARHGGLRICHLLPGALPWSVMDDHTVRHPMLSEYPLPHYSDVSWW